LPKGQLIGIASKIVDMIRIWKVLGWGISVGEEQICTYWYSPSPPFP
jgi:hypothetical protein